ncbi:hypothetical protein Srubr_18290 [Streptomyces rubradiris]|uniref:AMP-binding enzyme C-terminal domain-containing protein n=1 Tax=Streptomyces rubradiris TaxID=285531 RepID=A0ABQ3R810_STRRR|nr:hypothetical protein Srubr_18290 [Streptomyces rubradiris]
MPRELSTFKLPEEVYEVAGVPRTASGKIQRRLLADQPAVLRCTAAGCTTECCAWSGCPRRPAAPPAPAPTTWAFVGSAAAGLAAAAGSSSCYADLATAGAAEMTVLLAPDMPGTWAERRAGIEPAGRGADGCGRAEPIGAAGPRDPAGTVAVSARDDLGRSAQAMLAAAGRARCWGAGQPV